MKKQHNKTDVQNIEINQEITPNTDNLSDTKIVNGSEIEIESQATNDQFQPQTDTINHKIEEEQIMADTQEKNLEKNQRQKSSSGKGIALLALLVALGVGGAGYYLGQQQLSQLQQKMALLEDLKQQSDKSVLSETVSKEDFAALQETLKNATDELAKTKSVLSAAEQQRSVTEQQIIALQSQLNKVVSDKADSKPNDWLMSEADFLLSNAQRKLIIDNDLGAAISLLKEADTILNDVSDPRAISVRTAIAQDLRRLGDVNDIDQNAIMQKLSQLANTVDDLELLDLSTDNREANDNEVSDSITDWRTNIKKSATSFLNHFIRIKPRETADKAVLAPNQDVYLRENIRLRLQIALLAVPRQQNELYKGSLEAVTAWIRSYFNTDSVLVQRFLQQLDDLSEQSIYVDAPTTFESLSILDEILHKQSHTIEKIEIKPNPQLLEESKADSEKENSDTPVQPIEQSKSEVESSADQPQQNQQDPNKENQQPAKVE